MKPKDDPGFAALIGALLLFGGMAPAMGVTGYWPVFDIGLVGGLAFAAASGGLGGLILGRTNRVVGLVCGVLIGIGGTIAAFLYTGYLRTESVWNVEVALVAGVGALPGALLWGRLTKQRKRPDRG
jgi:hypothetical protein